MSRLEQTQTKTDNEECSIVVEERNDLQTTPHTEGSSASSAENRLWKCAAADAVKLARDEVTLLMLTVLYILRFLDSLRHLRMQGSAVNRH